MFRKDLALVVTPSASFFLKYFGHFSHDFFLLNMPKLVVLNLSGHDFNFLNSIFLPLTVSWPFCLATLSSDCIFFGFSKDTSWFIMCRIL